MEGVWQRTQLVEQIRPLHCPLLRAPRASRAFPAACFARAMKLPLIILAAGFLGFTQIALAGGPEVLRGTWALDRAQSESMREMLAAQGYNGLEIGVLERVPVTQVIEPTANRVVIRARSSVVQSTEELALDDVARPAESPLGRVERAAAWDEGAQSLRTRLRYKARNGQDAEMWVVRRPLDAGRFAQETRVRLADGREFRARQVFVRK